MEVALDVVTISPKYQIVIPLSIRKHLNLVPGQKMQALIHDDRVELIPVRLAASLRGFLRGIDTTLIRDAGRG